MGAKNSDSLPCMGASAFLKSVDFGAFAVNVKNDSTHSKIVSIWSRNMVAYGVDDRRDIFGKL